MNKYIFKDKEAYFLYKDTLVHECLYDFIVSFYTKEY